MSKPLTYTKCRNYLTMQYAKTDNIYKMIEPKPIKDTKNQNQ